MSIPANTTTILIGAIDDSKHRELIDAIINANGIDELYSSESHRTCTMFHTIHRSTHIRFCRQLHPALSARSTDESIEAFLLYLDHPLDSLVEELKIWKQVDPTRGKIFSLVSKHSIPKDQLEAVLAWCRKNSCELIELDCVGNPNADNFHYFTNKFGIEHLVQILRDHIYWNVDDYPVNTPNITPYPNYEIGNVSFAPS